MYLMLGYDQFQLSVSSHKFFLKDCMVLELGRWGREKRGMRLKNLISTDD